MTALVDIARAVHTVLATSNIIKDSLGTPPRLYDHAPEDPVFPYLSYGAMRQQDVGGDESPLQSHQMTLHLWSRYSGRSEILSLVEQVKTVLSDDADFQTALNTRNLVSLSFLYTDILRAPDGRTHHGLLRLSILTDQ
jgi:hypothetical protein